MRDPFTWSFPIGRMFGILVRIHLLFPLVVGALILRAAADKNVIAGSWIDMTMLMALLFFTVLLHEFGHCFAARKVGGEANEVLLWPLGGLASVDVPHSPRAHFLTAAGGPAVNLLICLGAGLVMFFAFEQRWLPPLNPFWYPFRENAAGDVFLSTWNGMHSLTFDADNHLTSVNMQVPLAALVMARLFYVAWVTFLLNVLVMGYPLDGGRMFQSILWPYVGYRQATLYAVFAGFVCMFLLLFVSLFQNEVMLLLLAFLIYTACKQQWIILETGGEDSLFGYDFSQGYTSLERDQPPPPRRPQPNFIQRWWQRRTARKIQREQQRQVEEEHRLDQLLEKIHRSGKESLTDEEQRFLKRVADRHRNRP